MENLVPNESRTLEFIWSTTVIENHTIPAEYSIVQYEIDTTDNNRTDGTVWVRGDSTPPHIGTPSQNPPRDNVMPNHEVKVSVNVTDAESGVKNVTLFYTINSGPTWENRTMNYNASTSLYEATIPGQPAGKWVKFKIVAYDYAGNNATKDGTEPYCTYQVIPEFPLILILPLFMIATLLIIIVYKRKRLAVSKRID